MEVSQAKRELHEAQFRLRLDLFRSRVKKSVSATELAHIVNKAATWCCLEIADPSKVVELYERKQASSLRRKAKREPNSPLKRSVTTSGSRTMSLSCLFKVLHYCFVKGTVKILRIKPQPELTAQKYLLVLYTLVEDYHTLNEVLVHYSEENADLARKLTAYSTKYEDLLRSVDRSKSTGLEEFNLTTATVKSILAATLKDIEAIKATDVEEEFRNVLEAMEAFYHDQLSVLREQPHWEQEITEKRSDFLVSLFQKKLITSLASKKAKPLQKVHKYRETLLKLYLELLKEFTPEDFDGDELDILRKVQNCKQNPAELAVLRKYLIQHWRQLSPQFSDIVDQYMVKASEPSAEAHSEAFLVTQEQFDSILGFVIQRIGQEVPKAFGREFIKVQGLMQKYINFKEKRLTVYESPALMKEFCLNVVQNIVWDYQDLSRVSETTTKGLTSRYDALLDLLQHPETNLSKWEHDSLFTVEIAEFYLVLIRQERPELDYEEDFSQLNQFREAVFGGELCKEEVFLVQLLAGQMLKEGVGFPEVYFKFIYKLKALGKANSPINRACKLMARKYIANFSLQSMNESINRSLDITIGDEEGSSHKVQSMLSGLESSFRNYGSMMSEISQSLSRYCQAQKELEMQPEVVKDLEGLANHYEDEAKQLQAIQLGVPVLPELSQPEPEEPAFSTQAIKALRSIFKFYTSQNLEAKSTCYMTFDQLKLFCIDFQVASETGVGIPLAVIRQVFLCNASGKASINELQFLTLIELLAPLYYNKSYDDERHTQHRTLPTKSKIKEFLKELGCDGSYTHKLVGLKTFSIKKEFPSPRKVLEKVVSPPRSKLKQVKPKRLGFPKGQFSPRGVLNNQRRTLRSKTFLTRCTTADWFDDQGSPNAH